MPVSMTVSWPPSQHNNSILYQLQYRPVGASVWISARPTPGPGTSQVVTGLQANTNYEFRHVATNAGWTEVSVATTLHTGVLPGSPTRLKVTN
jgi:hypothetical protein